MVDKAYWATFPATYRSRQVEMISRWATIGESGSVVGMAGSGKSNILGFVASRVELMRQHMPSGREVCFIYFDINSVPNLTDAGFFRGMMYAVRSSLVDMPSHLQNRLGLWMQNTAEWNDPFAALMSLNEIHHILSQEPGLMIVWLFDRFDEAVQQLDAQTLNTLRSLRDQGRGRISLVVATRQPIARLRNPHEIDALHELVHGRSCWVTPMSRQDVHWLATQMAERLRTAFHHSTVEAMFIVTGGLPGYLKIGLTDLADGVLTYRQPPVEWVEILAKQPAIHRFSLEIWEDLDQREQALVTRLAQSSCKTHEIADADTLHYLLHLGLIVPTPTTDGYKLFSPLFASFVRATQAADAAWFDVDSKTGLIMRNGFPIDTDLAPLEAKLLAYLVRRSGEICTFDEIIRDVWGDEVGLHAVSNESISQQISRLRRKLEDDPKKPQFIQTFPRRGYRFMPPK